MIGVSLLNQLLSLAHLDPTWIWLVPVTRPVKQNTSHGNKKTGFLTFHESSCLFNDGVLISMVYEIIPNITG